MSGRPPILRSLLAYVAVLGACAWPWIAAASRALPAGALLIAPSNARLHVWILAWVSHALATDPRRLFDANISYPAPAQLAAAEHFLSSQLLFAPVYAATGNALLGANVLALASYPLAALAMERLLLALGCGRGAAWTGGMIFALGPLRVPGNLHLIQYLNFYLPLTALAVRALRARPTWGRAASLALVLVAGLFSSYYTALLVCVTGALWGVAELVRPGRGRTPFVAFGLGAGAVAVALLAAVSRPYLARPEAAAAQLNLYPGDEIMYAEYREIPGLQPLLSFIFRGSSDYTVSAQMLQDPAFWGRVALGILVVCVRGWFGIVPLALAAGGLLALRSRAPGARRTARWGLLLVGLTAALMLGPTQRVLDWTIHLPFAALVATPARFFRFPFRFVVLAGLGTALLGAAALEGAQQALGPRAGRVLVAVALGAVLATRGVALKGDGLDVMRAQSLPIYDTLRAVTAEEPGPLLELPLAEPTGHGLDRDAMVGSTRHWLPLVNGFTGFPAPHRHLIRDMVARLPAPEALEDLVDLTHLRWLLVHPPADWGGSPVREALLRLPSVRPVAERDGWVIARVDRIPEHQEWFDAVAAGRLPAFGAVRDTTFER